MLHTLRIHQNEIMNEYKVEEGISLFRFLTGISSGIDSYCSGNGTCGKCRVKAAGSLEEPGLKEKLLLGSQLENGYRLACYIKVASDMDVYLDAASKSKAKIASEGKFRDVGLHPAVTKKFVSLDPPGLEDQRSDLERLESAGYDVSDDLELIRALPKALRQNDYSLTLVCFNNRVVSVESGNTTDRLYGVAFDIGTTTVVGYLWDLTAGKRIAVHSALNPQKAFGADVISRINSTMESDAANRTLQRLIVDCINSIISHFENSTRITRDDIYSAVFAGNTTMLHFLMDLPAKYIAASPYIPATNRMHQFKASHIGIGINKEGMAVVLPSVSGYIGADTVAAVLASGIYADKRISLLIDIGTNGEIVLGNSNWMYSCSAAAGPAFEGANIRNGVAGIAGAIDRIEFSPVFRYTTIGDEKAVGICGSGIVDAVSGMLKAGIIDETGRLLGRELLAAGVAEDLKGRLVDHNGQSAFLISAREESSCETDILITQKDIRELQNAKAAIAAGIGILAEQAGIGYGDIEKVYLAGGFGSYLNIESAFGIGLLPGELRGKVEAIGNAAGIGAIYGLLSVDMLSDAEVIKNRMKYIELSSYAGFMDHYIDNMTF